MSTEKEIYEVAEAHNVNMDYIKLLRNSDGVYTTAPDFDANEDPYVCLKRYNRQAHKLAYWLCEDGIWKSYLKYHNESDKSFRFTEKL